MLADPRICYAFPSIGIIAEILPGKSLAVILMPTFQWFSSTMASLIVSLSDGTLALLRPDPVNGLTIEETWHAHDHEPWAVGWEYWNNSIIYSGMLHITMSFDLVDLEQGETILSSNCGTFVLVMISQFK